MTMPFAARSRTRAPGRFIALAVLMMLAVGGFAPHPVHAQDALAFPDLDPARRVYDETGSSLTTEQQAQLEVQIADLEASGANVIVYVRALDATPSETLDQVEALQQAWVARTNADQDTAVAILINRNPNDSNDARAGIFVGKSFNEGNVPESEQRAIVDKALIPPLRDGDVYGSFSDGLRRLENSILNGPPRGAFEKWAEGAGDSWFPWVNTALAAVGGVGAALLFRQRQHLGRPDLPPTTARPGNLTPALASALVGGGPQSSAFPATLVDLAGRGAVSVEPESEGGTFSQPKIHVRLRNGDLVRDEIEAVVWSQLEKKARMGVVSSKDLARIAADSGDRDKALDNQMVIAGWKDERAGSRKLGLGLIAALALGLAVFAVVVAAVGEAWWATVGAAALAIVAVLGIVNLTRYSSLSLAGQEAALPWKAYRDGLKEAMDDETASLDMDAVLPDVLAMNQGSALDKRLKDASATGSGLRIFQSTLEGSSGAYAGSTFPYWVAFNASVTAPSSSSSSGTVSGGGAGGGSGAAGST
jgi:uncharacterized membrane protein YgcG